MKKMIFAAAALAAALNSSAQGVTADYEPSGMLSYALPRTVLVFDVEAVRETFHAGPYARYSEKYLGVKAKAADFVNYSVTALEVTPLIEADQNARYNVALGKGASGATFLQMTAQGLICVSDGGFGGKSVWRFPAGKESDFASRGLGSNLTSRATTLYQKSSTSKVQVQQNMVVEKSDEQKAREAAEMIFKLRSTRVQIVTGDTDANYGGEAMSSALEELERLEKEYLSLFIGYSDFETQRKRFDVVPCNDIDTPMVVAFRLSDAEGLLPADNVSGKPYFLEITPESIMTTGEARNSSRSGFVYRIPAICTVKLSDGARTLFQGRLPIYQFGADKRYSL